MLKRFVGFLVIAILMGCANTDIGAANTDEIKVRPDYQKLLGSWEWAYPVGNSIITIVGVTETDGKFALRGFYKPCPPSCDATRGMPLTGTIDPQQNPNEVALVLQNGSRLNLRWNGESRMRGYAVLQSWSGSVDFEKR